MSGSVLFLFGAPRLERNRKPVPLDTRKALALISYLAMTRTSHSRDALATLLWEDYDQSRARAALRRTLSVLHSALGDEQLDIDRELVGLSSRARLTVDVYEFQKRLADCQGHDHPIADVCPRCVTPLSEAAALYHDDFMAGFTLRDSRSFDEWQFFQAEALRRDLAGVLERLTHFHSRQSELDQAIVYALRWLTLDPLHEPAHRHLMQLYAANGQRAAALRQYQECVRALKSELGVEPLEETTRLYESIKAQKESLVLGASSQTGEDHLPVTRYSQPHHYYPLVGRASELGALKDMYAAVRSDGHFVLLEGEAGIGKTRLAETFLASVQTRGGHSVLARCFEGGANLAYGPFIESMRSALADSERANRLRKVSPHFLGEAARLLPEVRMLHPRLPDLPPLESPGAASRFFEGISQVLMAILSSRMPGVLFIDDLQWADVASLDLLTYLIQRLRGRPLFVLCTGRGEEIPAGHRLHQMLVEAQRGGLATRMVLSRLDASAVMELANATGDWTPEIGRRLYLESEGLPFFVVEYLKAIGDERRAPPAANWALPGGVRALLHSRLAGVTETGWQLLNAAAVIGRSFDFDTLREASGRSEEETVVGLERLTAQGLIREVSAGAVGRGLVYDFSHEKLRNLVYEETSQARRRLLHRRVAESLVTQARVSHLGDALASQIAQHYAQAGLEAPAAEFFQRAGEHARTLYANAQALADFQSALEFHHPDTGGLYEAIGDLHTLMGDYGAALTAYETAARLYAPKMLASLEHKRGSLYHRRGEWELADAHFSSALAALGGTESTKECARLYADWSLTAHQMNHTGRAQELAGRALELAQGANDSRALAQAHNILGILANSRGELEQAQAHFETSVRLGQTLGDPGIRAAALNNLALTFGARGEIDRALALTLNALDLCASVGDRHREAALHNNLADLYHSAGQSEAAMAHLKQAVTIFAEIGEEAGHWQPEIWKLVQW
ncbi:MAG: ATP-binding protein [Acidobacteriota bacterium]